MLTIDIDSSLSKERSMLLLLRLILEGTFSIKVLTDSSFFIVITCFETLYGERKSCEAEKEKKLRGSLASKVEVSNLGTMSRLKIRIV